MAEPAVDVSIRCRNLCELPPRLDLGDGAILQTDGWCGGRVDGLDEQYPDFFPNNKTHRPPEPAVRRHLWEIPEAPQIIKTNHLNMMIDRHESHAKTHLDKAQFYRDARHGFYARLSALGSGRCLKNLPLCDLR